MSHNGCIGLHSNQTPCGCLFTALIVNRCSASPQVDLEINEKILNLNNREMQFRNIWRRHKCFIYSL